MENQENWLLDTRTIKAYVYNVKYILLDVFNLCNVYYVIMYTKCVTVLYVDVVDMLTSVYNININNGTQAMSC